MSEKGTEPDIAPRRVNVAEVPEADLSGARDPAVTSLANVWHYLECTSKNVLQNATVAR
jgi:hypothetical protein